MSRTRFTPIKSRNGIRLGAVPSHNHPETPAPHDDDAVTPNEVMRFVLRIVFVFAAIVGVPTVIAHAVHRGPMPDVTAWLNTTDAKTGVRVYDTGSQSTSTMPLNTYILDVLAAEFPPNTPMTSLEAAAVATRTYAVHAMQGSSGSSPLAKSHNADVTNDSQLDLPLANEQDIEAEYPNDSFQFLSRLQAAVETTDGLVLTYQKQPILAFMFELSPGTTLSSQDVFHHNIPYLQAIKCPDDAVDPDGTSTNTFEPREVAQAFSLPTVQWSELKMSRAPNGFVSTVTYGKQVISGADFANLLHLPSADFTWQVRPQGLVITSHGRGTNIGMSLHEAQALAAKGMSWKDILAKFYPGTTVQLDDGMVGTGE
ncbi:SpoIID/LytB domain-containing protein [Alicyclobacillus dauci]|uniref:SpoIID/LytB domain-containing protein n=1 Tax=Alicyclobacillus dauci TaxID=1475485 RepID=A0ABY6Z3S1_9BACL|nr:SpoIID/LytB domain-containing protein [Alicyclobacillus dauci]WAH36851.1 SpoIID/LytB domain-containing protein [Alicyclobacillus dauci]